MNVPLERCWAIAPGYVPELCVSSSRLEALQERRIDARPADDPLEIVADTVAVIPVRGILTRKRSIFQSIFGGYSMTEIRAAVVRASRDDRVRQIVLRIDSPGGTVSGTQELADAVGAAAQTKPVIAQVDGQATSAAYWVASQATEIRAGSMDLVGSIGVLAVYYDLSEAYSDGGIKPVVFSTGEHKAMGVPGVEITDEQVAQYQTLVDGMFADFQSAVQTGRKLGAATMQKYADARIVMARDATGELVDAVRTFEQTMAGILDRAGREQATRAARARLARS